MHDLSWIWPIWVADTRPCMLTVTPTPKRSCWSIGGHTWKAGSETTGTTDRPMRALDWAFAVLGWALLKLNARRRRGEAAACLCKLRCWALCFLTLTSLFALHLLLPLLCSFELFPWLLPFTFNQTEPPSGRADSATAAASGAVTTNECIKLTRIKHFKFCYSKLSLMSNSQKIKSLMCTSFVPKCLSFLFSEKQFWLNIYKKY